MIAPGVKCVFIGNAEFEKIAMESLIKYKGTKNIKADVRLIGLRCTVIDRFPDPPGGWDHHPDIQWMKPFWPLWIIEWIDKPPTDGKYAFPACCLRPIDDQRDPALTELLNKLKLKEKVS